MGIATTFRRRSADQVLAGLVATALALALGLAQQPEAAADHTPLPTSVALVGSLQSELGCPGDWAPECPNTELAPVTGRRECSPPHSTCPRAAMNTRSP